MPCFSKARVHFRLMGMTKVESAHGGARALRTRVLSCSLLALPPCDTVVGDGDVGDDVVQATPPASPPAPSPTATTPATRCLETGGQPTERACCRTAEPFPSTCGAGACDCLPADAKVIPYCECGSVCFDPQFGCVDWR